MRSEAATRDPAAYDAYLRGRAIARTDPVDLRQKLRYFQHALHRHCNPPAFPDDQVSIELLTADGDVVSYRATENGTHKAEFLKIPATGKHATWTEIQFFRIANGKVVEHWVDVDIFGWFQQLGVIPPMG